ncbi:MAG: AraC family transcriptional regulator [Clostridia bacterium]|nr:AraC family transcriptional regulator [Clostridia bacterium]
MSLNVRYEQKTQDISFIGGHNIQCMPHLHRELELVCLLEGDVVAYADSMRCELHAGDIFLTFPNQIHSYEKRSHETHLGFIFKPDLLPEMMETFTMGTPRSPVIPGAARNPHIRALIDQLAGTRERDSFPHLSELRRGYLLALCAELLPLMTIVKLPAGDSETLRTIVSFCTQNYAENLSLSLLEEKLHLNKFYISHLFSGRLGLGFNDYINSLRVSEACRYLLNSDHSVTEIGSLVGFNTPRTFNRAFMRQMGVSPTEYRKERRSEIREHIKNSMEPPTAAMLSRPFGNADDDAVVGTGLGCLDDTCEYTGSEDSTYDVYSTYEDPDCCDGCSEL